MPVPQFLHTFLGGGRVDMTEMPLANGMFDDYMVQGKGDLKQWPRTEKGIQTIIVSLFSVYRNLSYIPLDCIISDSRHA